MQHEHIHHLREKIRSAELRARAFHDTARHLAGELDSELLKACAVHAGDIVKTSAGKELLVDKVSAVDGKLWAHGTPKTKTGAWSKRPCAITLPCPDEEE